MIRILILVAAIFCLIAFMLFLALNRLYINTNHYENSRIDFRKCTLENAHRAHFVNLGSTYSKFAFGTSSSLDIRMLDLSMRSQGLDSDYKLLKSFIPHLISGSTVLIVIAPCLLLYRENSSSRQLKDALLANGLLKSGLSTNLGGQFPLLQNWKKAKYILNDEPPLRDIYDTYKEPLSKKEKEAEINALFKTWEHLFNINDFKSNTLSNELGVSIGKNMETLSAIADCCRRAHLNCAIVSVPFSRNLNARFSDEFVNAAMVNPIRCFTEENADIPFLDYRLHPDFQANESLFLDGGFRLNKRGSKLFLQHLSNDLRKNDRQDVRKNGTTE